MRDKIIALNRLLDFRDVINEILNSVVFLYDLLFGYHDDFGHVLDVLLVVGDVRDRAKGLDLV